MKHSILIMATASLLLGGCSQSEMEESTVDEMRFTVNYPKATRVADSDFEKNDSIGVYVVQYSGDNVLPLQVAGNYANNAQTGYDGSQWKSSPTIYWDEGKFDVYAYYPYAKPASVDEYRFAVATDQSTEQVGSTLGGYEQSDLLWTKSTGVTRTASVPLTFKHLMSRLIINIVKGTNFTGDVPADAIVRVHGTYNQAFVDLKSGMVVKDNRYEERTVTITAKRLSETTFAAIIVPQRTEAKGPFIEIIANGVSYLVEGTFVFKTGMQHTLNVTLNSDPSRVKIEVGGEISDWDE